MTAPAALERRIADAQRAWQNSADLRRTSDAFRLFDERSGAWPGIRVEVFGSWAVLGDFGSGAGEAAAILARALLAVGLNGVYLKRHLRARAPDVRGEALAPALPIAGQPAPASYAVREGPLKLLVSLGDGLMTGLFVDQRDNRRRIREQARGRRFLNLFAYTCSFSAAAALGGSAASVSIDISNKALARGRENLRINRATGDHRFISEDVQRWLPRARRRGERYDLAVLDPPTFARARRSSFKLERDYVRVAADCLALLTSSGQLLAATNQRRLDRNGFEGMLRAAASQAGRELRALKHLPPQRDCPRGPDGGEPVKNVLLTVR